MPSNTTHTNNTNSALSQTPSTSSPSPDNLAGQVGLLRIIPALTETLLQTFAPSYSNQGQETHRKNEEARQRRARNRRVKNGGKKSEENQQPLSVKSEAKPEPRSQTVFQELNTQDTQPAMGAIPSATSGNLISQSLNFITHSVSSIWEQARQTPAKPSEDSASHHSRNTAMDDYPSLVDVDALVENNQAYHVQGVNPKGQTGESVATLSADTDSSLDALLIGSPGNYNDGKNPDNGRVDIVPADKLTEKNLSSLDEIASTTYTSQAGFNTGFEVRTGLDMNQNGEEDILIMAQNRSTPHSTILLYDVKKSSRKHQHIDLDNLQAGEGSYFYQRPLGGDDYYPYVNLERSAGPVGKIMTNNTGMLISGCEDPTAKSDNNAEDYTDNLVFITAKEGGYPLNVDISGLDFGKDATLIYSLEDNYGKTGQNPNYIFANVGPLLGGDLDATLVGMPHTALSGRLCSDGLTPEGKMVLMPGEAHSTLPIRFKHTEKYMKENALTFYGDINDHAGESVMGGYQFDFNCDHFDDIGIGLPHTDGDITSGKGSVAVLYGPFTKERFPGAYTNISSITPEQGTVITGRCEGDATGFKLTSAGNFHGGQYPDGSPCYGDVLISTKRGNTAYVLYAKPNQPSHIDLSSLAQGQGTQFITSDVNAQFGQTVTSGHFNSDEYTDIVIGAPGKFNEMGGFYMIPGGQKNLPAAGTLPACPQYPTPSPTPSAGCPTPTPFHIRPTPTPISTPTPTPVQTPHADHHETHWKKDLAIGLGVTAGALALGALGFFAVKQCRGKQDNSEGQALLYDVRKGVN